jgi:6-pyruvoyltetrahydropterin/6-carboxytetrahydropterin synthase
MVHLTRRYWFSASHRLHNAVLDPEHNRELYGKCNNPGGHGHNYHVEITVRGEIDPHTGMVVNLAELDELVRGQIIERFDQENLNEDPLFHTRVPTTENLCLEIYRIAKESCHHLPSAARARLEKVRLEETSSNFFECRTEAAGGDGEEQ